MSVWVSLGQVWSGQFRFAQVIPGCSGLFSLSGKGLLAFVSKVRTG